MADYDLGKAHGEVVIDYDNKNIKNADKDVEKLGETTKKSSKEIQEAARQAAAAYEQTQKAAKLLAAEVAKAAVAEEAARARIATVEKEAKAAREASAQAAAKAKAAEDVLNASRAVSAARTAAAKQAEDTLRASRDSGASSTRQIAEAERAVEAARSAAGDAAKQVAQAEQAATTARERSSSAAKSAAASERQLEQAHAKVSAAAQKSKVAHDALNSTLSKLKNQKIEIDLDSKGGSGLRDLINSIRDVDNTARSGLSGLNSFVGRTQAMIGAAALAAPHLAGLAISLAQVAQAGALLPGILAAGGAAIGTLMVGASGIGDAFKESGKAAAGAGAAAKQSAQAQKAAADAIRSAEQGLASAKENLTVAYEDAARAAEQSVRRVAEAEKSVVAAQKTAIRAQMDLTAARKDAKRMIEDYALAVRGGAIDEREAIASVAEAQKELDDVMRTPAATQADRDKAQLALDRQKFTLDELRVRNQRLGEDASDATAKQIEGSDQVVSAQEAVAAAAQSIADAQQSVKDAVADQARSQVDSQRSIASAIQAVENAELALQRAHESSAEAGISGAAGVESAMSKLSPKAQEFVKAVLAQAGAWKEVKFAVQDALFDNAAAAVTQLANRYLPILKTGMVGIATEVNGVGMQFKNFLLEAQTTKDVATIFDNTKLSVKALGPGLIAIVQMFRDIAAVGSDFLPGLAGGFSEAAKKAAEFVKQARESGKLKEFMQEGIDAAKVLFEVLKNIGSIFITIFQAFDQTGGGTLQLLRDLTGQLDDFLKSAEGQDFLKELGKTLYTIGNEGMKVVMQALDILIPLLTDLAPIVQDVAKNFGEVLGGALEFLAPLLESLGHFVQNNSDWIVKIATAIGIWTAAQWLLNFALDANPIGAVIVAIIALIAIVQLIIDNWGPISTFFKDLWDGIALYFQLKWEAISKWFSDTIDGIVTFFKVKWQNLSDWFHETIDGIELYFQTRWQAISDWFSQTLTDIGHFFRDGWNNIWKWFTDVLTGMRDDANRRIGEIASFFRDLPGNVRDWLGNLGTYLLQQGREIIQGFLDGLLEKWHQVQNFVSGIADWIGDHKGPLSYDRQLLVAAGQAIMGGFNDSLQSEFEKVMAFVATVGPSVANAAKTADIKSTMELSTVLGGTSGSLGTLSAANAVGMSSGSSTGGGVATLERPSGQTVVIENLYVTGNLDPTDPVKWRETIKRLEDDLNQLGRDNQ